MKWKGCFQFRQRIICSTLAGISIKITNIRDNDENPGIRDFETSFLQLIEKITNGCQIYINETGTEVYYKPGIIIGGTIIHNCPTSRSIGYFLEGIIGLAPFGKQPLNITFNGITNDDQDPSVDLLRTVTIPLLKKFGIEEDIELKIKKRGAPPQGGGQVLFICPIIKHLQPLHLIDEGKIRRIRGIAYSTRVSPQIGNRLVESAKEILNSFQQDIYIYTDHYKGNESGLSPGFGLLLVAESTTGCSLSAEAVGSAKIVPEDLGKKVSNILLNEIRNGGCVDTTNQTIALLFMTLCSGNVSKIRLGKLSPYTIEYFKLLKEFFGIIFKIEPDLENNTVICTCLGVGFKNISKKIY
jgi:RNA 3'-terminal phosphate cyclase-like protein